MKMLALLVAAAAALTCVGCKPEPTGADGYYFEGPQFKRDQAVVHFVSVKNDAELKRIGIEHHISFSRDQLKDLVLLTPDGCTVFVVDPTVHYEPQWLGHALAHCLYGDFHQKQNAERQ